MCIEKLIPPIASPRGAKGVPDTLTKFMPMCMSEYAYGILNWLGNRSYHGCSHVLDFTIRPLFFRNFNRQIQPVSPLFPRPNVVAYFRISD